MFVEDKARGEKQSGPDLSKPSLLGLAHVLRHPELWPEGFHWDYSQAPCCAMGLGYELWPDEIPYMGVDAMAEALGISVRKSIRIFREGNLNWFGCPRTRPTQIARTLEILAFERSLAENGVVAVPCDLIV